jgi:predicted DNA-binding antitoxin AbrB/MazE fold protein
MTISIEAIYENGVLRPLEPLGLAEQQHVHVTIAPTARSLPDEWLDHQFIQSCAGYRNESITAEQIRRLTATIPDSMADQVRADRDDP